VHPQCASFIKQCIPSCIYFSAQQPTAIDPLLPEQGDSEITGRDEPASDVSTPVSGVKTPVSGGETFVSDRISPVSGGETPVSGGETPISGGETPVSGTKANTSGGEASSGPPSPDCSNSEEISGTVAKMSDTKAQVNLSKLRICQHRV